MSSLSNKSITFQCWWKIWRVWPNNKSREFFKNKKKKEGNIQRQIDVAAVWWTSRATELSTGPAAALVVGTCCRRVVVFLSSYRSSDNIYFFPLKPGSLCPNPSVFFCSTHEHWNVGNSQGKILFFQINISIGFFFVFVFVCFVWLWSRVLKKKPMGNSRGTLKSWRHMDVNLHIVRAWRGGRGAHHTAVWIIGALVFETGDRW